MTRRITAIDDLAAAVDDQAHWAERALCQETDPDAFFPEKGENVSKGAKRVCGACPVDVECLAYALANNERFGIWGGKTERERRKILKESA
ncbi:WhiB family transcriptional regulator [Nakamurella silvestris]|nr:WhiB family transcriptional regulator [Nakamurella silvestris]